MSKIQIIGAGLSGLMAANLFQTAEVFEAGPREQVSHRALLRFRSPAVGDAMGVDFRKVRVYKGVYDVDTEQFVHPDIRYANCYSHKVTGRIHDRSIWNLAAADRWVAPDNLIEQLVERCGARIHWDTPFDFQEHRAERDNPVISTAPMPAIVKMLGVQREMPQFKFAPIHVTRFNLPDCDVFQTVYFPNTAFSVYRASITGHLAIVESMRAPTDEELDTVFGAFGLRNYPRRLKEPSREQKYGKIASINDGMRRAMIAELTREHNVYSLGRFAVWRNILADDVLNDIAVLKKLIAGDTYARQKAAFR